MRPHRGVHPRRGLILATTFHLIRHAHTDAVGHRLAGRTSIGLSAAGLKRARERGTGTGLPIAGLVCGIVGAVVGLLVSIGVLVTLGTSNTTY